MSAAMGSASGRSKKGASTCSTFLTPSSFAASLGSAAGIAAGDQHMDVAAKLACRGERLGRCVLQMSVVVLGDEKDGHHQITPASSLSFCTSSLTDFTFTPAWRFGGSTSSPP